MFEDQSRLRLGLSYYDYLNITGNLGPPGTTDLTSAPDTLQKGNSLFDISNSDINNDGVIDVNDLERRFGLASDFNLLNLTAEYDLARFAPIHVILTGDYVKNIGYDADEIEDRQQGRTLIVNNGFAGDPDKEETDGFLAKVTVGWPDLRRRRAWQLAFAYKYLERDAVLDAFSDSDFHLGGTNAEGWIASASYGVLENTYLKLRYLSADEIEGPPLGIDVLQLDLVSRF